MMGLLKGRVRHRTFLSYHPDDQEEVRAFVDYFDHNQDVLVYCAQNPAVDTAIVYSDDRDYALRRIRELYLEGSEVTLVLIGMCTWASRVIDWEISASLQSMGKQVPNGLLGIVLPSAHNNVTIPLRLQSNLSSGYARIYPYTYRLGQLADAIYDAFRARTTRVEQIVNRQPLQTEDAPCT
jgi:hypothetical protein